MLEIIKENQMKEVYLLEGFLSYFLLIFIMENFTNENPKKTVQ